jgi:hypothetical protein
MIRRREGGALRGRRENERAVQREDETVAQREARQQPAYAMIRREGGAMRGWWEVRREDEMAAWWRWEVKRAAQRQATQQPAGTTRGQEGDATRQWVFSSIQFHLYLYCSVHCLNDCRLILIPFNRGGVTISRPSLYFCISIFLGEIVRQNANPNKVTLQPMLWRRHPIDARI